MEYRYPDVDQISRYITGLFRTDHPNGSCLLYHNLQHTLAVVERTQEIADFYKLSEKHRSIVLTAAWFHDCGHLRGPSSGHEERSVQLMQNYLKGHRLDQDMLACIEACIRATAYPSRPGNLLTGILCDADLYHLGTTEFAALDLLAKREYELRNKMIAINWDENALILLVTHSYHTNYCRKLLKKGKGENILLLRKKIQMIKQ